MNDFVRNYGKQSLAILAFGAVLMLDELFTRPLSFVTGVAAPTLKQYELSLFVFAVTLFLAKLVRRDFVHGVLERRSGGEMPKLIGDLSSTVVLFIGVCVISAFVFKKDITALLATGGAGLMILGIALRDLLLAAFTGVLMNIEKPFRPGDLIRVNDKYTGRVEQITWRATILQTLSNEKLVIPNLLLSNAVIINYAMPDTRSRRSLEVIIDYDTSVESAERILYAAVLGAEVNMAVPPAVNARRMERDGVVYEIMFTIVDYMDYKAAEHAVIKSVLNCMRDADITVSFPKSEVIQTERRVHIADRSLDIFHLVQQVRLFRRLSEDLCHRIADLLIQHHFTKGQTIVRAGEQRFSMFIVGEGMTRRHQTNRDGSALIEQRFIATEAFGRKALFSCQSQAATVIAETNVLVYEFERGALARLIGEVPGLVGTMATELAYLGWQELRIGPPDREPDPATITHLVNLYRGQMEACYGVGLPATPAESVKRPVLVAAE